MRDSSEIEAIREKKLEELRATLENGDQAATDTEGDAAPRDPISIDSEQHLNDVLQRYDAVLVDFYADWCGPCKMLEPIVAELAAETAAAVAKVDIDAQRALAMQYQVRGVPTVVLFANGQAAERLSGVRDKGVYENLIAQHAN